MQRRLGDRDVDRGRKHVVGRLRRVDVVVGMHGTGLAEFFRRERGQHLVHVHVRRRTRARLKDIDRELLVPESLGHLSRSRRNGVGDALVDARDIAQARVDSRGFALDHRQSSDEPALDRKSRDREVLDGALCLCAPLRVGRNSHVPHRVVLDAVGKFCRNRRVAHTRTVYRPSPHSVIGWLTAIRPARRWCQAAVARGTWRRRSTAVARRRSRIHTPRGGAGPPGSRPREPSFVAAAALGPTTWSIRSFYSPVTSGRSSHA